ncbi:MAG: aminoglycoside phosphotransferase family protein [Anaerolineae bacterium]
MQDDAHRLTEEVRSWCASVLGPCEVIAGEARHHGRSSVVTLRASPGLYYAKVHQERLPWEAEVHAYEHWSSAFGVHAPALIALREGPTSLILLSALPGTTMNRVRLDERQKRTVWRSAGRSLAGLHDLAVGQHFGPCRRDGRSIGAPVTDPCVYVMAEFDAWSSRGRRAGCFTAEELAVIDAAQALVPAFAGEQPVPCHLDYCPDNWLVDADGDWTGVVDFEFSAWSVRVADFARYPEWEWIEQPGLLDALLEGYEHSWSAVEETQLLAWRTLYAVTAVVWGCEHEYLGFAAEGRKALRHLAGLLG